MVGVRVVGSYFGSGIFGTFYRGGQRMGEELTSASHVRDQDGHGGYRKQRPYNEERAAGITLRREITVADGEQRDVAEVECLEVAETLCFTLGDIEDGGTSQPEDAEGEDGNSKGSIVFERGGGVLDCTHGVETVFLFPED